MLVEVQTFSETAVRMRSGDKIGKDGFPPIAALETKWTRGGVRDRDESAILCWSSNSKHEAAL